MYATIWTYQTRKPPRLLWHWIVSKNSSKNKCRKKVTENCKKKSKKNCVYHCSISKFCKTRMEFLQYGFVFTSKSQSVLPTLPIKQNSCSKILDFCQAVTAWCFSETKALIIMLVLCSWLQCTLTFSFIWLFVEEQLKRSYLVLLNQHGWCCTEISFLKEIRKVLYVC